MTQAIFSPIPTAVIDVPAAQARVTALGVRLRSVAANLPTLVVSGVLDKTALVELVDAFHSSGPLAKDIVDQYDYYAAGLLRSLADELAAGRTAVDTQVLAYTSQSALSPKLTALLSNATAAAFVVEKSLRTIMAEYDIVGTLPTDLRPHVQGWLATRLPNPQPGEVRVLLTRVGAAEFAGMVRHYVEQKTLAASASVNLAGVAAAAESHILASKLVGPHLTGWVSPGDIANNFVVLDDTSFVAQFVTYFYQNNAARLQNLPYWRVMPVRDVDNVAGFSALGKMNLLEGCVSIQLCVHEAMHLLAEKRGHVWKKALGMVLEEAAAEYLCRLICQKAGVPYVLDGYYNNVLLLETIMDRGGLGEGQLIDGYLNGNTEPVIKAIEKISGAAGLHTLRTSTDQTGYATYNAWAQDYRAVESKTCLVQ